MMHACVPVPPLVAQQLPAAAAAAAALTRLSAAWRDAAAALIAVQQSAPSAAANPAAANDGERQHSSSSRQQQPHTVRSASSPSAGSYSSCSRRAAMGWLQLVKPQQLFRQPYQEGPGWSSHQQTVRYGGSSSSGASSHINAGNGSSIAYQLDPIHTPGSTSSSSGGAPPLPVPPAQRRVVAVALSGGVDSAVSALLLKRAGFELFGVYMHNWDPADEAGAQPPTCTAAADLEDAKAVAATLQIPLYEADFVATYWNRVFEVFLEGLQAGLTPNPDVACNSHIKFGALLQFARERGADALATGHYARLGWAAASTAAGVAWPVEAAGCEAAAAAAAWGDGGARLAPVLLTGADPAKDQSYFLAGLNQQQLVSSVFPVGHLSKPVVREMAAAAGLAPAAKRSSAGICFIGRRSFGRFLEGYLAPRPGLYVDLESCRTLGRCSNMLAVTVGQHALGLGGQRGRVYVAGKDLQAGVVHVVAGHDHPALFSSSVLLQPPSWVAGNAPGGLLQQAGRLMQYKARYRQPAGECTIRPLQQQFAGSQLCRFESQAGMVVADLAQPLRGVTPGQMFVMYNGQVCLGSSVIAAHGLTLYEAALR